MVTLDEIVFLVDERAELERHIKVVKLFTIVISIFVIIFGISMCMSHIESSLVCVLAGIFQMTAGTLILAIEAPKLFEEVSCLKVYYDQIGTKQYWVRALFYFLIILVPVILCKSWEAKFASISVYIVAILYGLIALRKKQEADQMTSQQRPIRNGQEQSARCSVYSIS